MEGNSKFQFHPSSHEKLVVPSYDAPPLIGREHPGSVDACAQMEWCKKVLTKSCKGFLANCTLGMEIGVLVRIWEVGVGLRNKVKGKRERERWIKEGEKGRKGRTRDHQSLLQHWSSCGVQSPGMQLHSKCTGLCGDTYSYMFSLPWREVFSFPYKLTVPAHSSRPFWKWVRGFGGLQWSRSPL